MHAPDAALPRAWFSLAWMPAPLPRLMSVLMMAGLLGVAPPAAVAGDAPGPTGDLPVDPASGLIMAENWEIVRAHCGACHSTRLVTQNRGSREDWRALLRWMQDSQGLWPFNEPTEALLLDYLATNYGPKPASRRPPLSVDLLPPG